MYLVPSILDIDADGKLELVLSTNNYIYVWDLNSTYDPSKMDWPMFQHDPTHTGNYEACSDGTLPGQCSYPKPSYCQNRGFISNCQVCGCPEGLTCVANGKCVNMIVSNNSNDQG